MKKIIEKFQNIFPDKNKKIAIYFIFYFIFFLLLFIFIIVNNNNDDKCLDNNKESTIDIKNNYGFRYEININGNEIVLSGSRYYNREKIDKRVEGLLTKYYVYYVDTYILNENNEWVKFDGELIENFDEKLLNMDYISELLENSELKSTATKKSIYYNKDEEITIEKNYSTPTTLDSIKVIDGTTSVVLKYFDKGKIEKFDIETKD